MLKILLIVLVDIIIFIAGFLIGSVVTAIGMGEELKEHENYGNGWGGLKWLKLSNKILPTSKNVMPLKQNKR